MNLKYSQEELDNIIQKAEKSNQEIDLKNADLRNMYFGDGYIKIDRADLQRVDFRGSTLYNVKFTNCKLKGADFRNANLVGILGDYKRSADFVNCDLTDADFSSTDVSLCSFRGCDLMDTDFSGCLLPNNYKRVFAGGRLIRTKFSGAKRKSGLIIISYYTYIIGALFFIFRLWKIAGINTGFGSPIFSLPFVLGLFTACISIPTILFVIGYILSKMTPKTTDY